MMELVYNLELVVGVILGVVLLVWIGILDSEFKRQKRELGRDVSEERILKTSQISGKYWSGRWDLNPRQLAWEARTLPLSYARSQSNYKQR